MLGSLKLLECLQNLILRLRLRETSRRFVVSHIATVLQHIFKFLFLCLATYLLLATSNCASIIKV